MNKIIPPGAWNFDGPQVELVKASSAGLRGADFADFVKRASHPLAAWVRLNPPAPGEVYVHSTALGATEMVGPNRNGDGYSAAMLQRDHPTFEKHARWYYNHKNTDPAKSYGVVKKAVYIPEVGRVDVIAALNGTKEAAARNGGLVAAKTLKKLASNSDVAVSQSCRVPIDVCSSCGNKARNRGEYCGPEHCKYGGCRDNLGRVFDDGFHLFVDNPGCTFFDLSDVSDTRGADRTAFVTGKVAAADHVVGGAELAEQLGLVVPDYLLSPAQLTALGELRKLAAFRPPPAFITPPASWDDCVAARRKLAAYANTPDLPFPAADHARHELLADLTAAGVVLPPGRWLAYMTGVAPAKCAAVFAGGVDVSRDFLARPDAVELLDEVPVKAAADSRVSSPWAWLAPSRKAHATESAAAVIGGDVKVIHPAAAGSAKLAAEVKCRYVAYQGRVLAAAAGTPAADVVMAECARHNTGRTA